MQRVRVPHPVALPLSIPGDWLEAHRGLDGTKLGVGGGTVVGFVVSEGFIYAYHRTAHRIDFMWRAFHQLHHSPNRVDIPGSVLFHPLEVVAQVVINLFATVIVLGLDPLAAALVGYLIAFCGYFQHWNVRTPQWLGYIIQRPESHCVHHRLRNPREFRGECGFEQGGHRRLGAMLAFADVNAPVYGAGSRGVKPDAAGAAAG